MARNGAKRRRRSIIVVVLVAHHALNVTSAVGNVKPVVLRVYVSARMNPSLAAK
jgi:hypothetical protein